jgi:hypothetical protein
LAAGAVSLVICAVVLRKQGPVDSGAWATVAAALAVLAAMISAWTSQRQLELQEDAAQPAVLPAIDLRSRTNLAQFTMTNHGGSHAYSVAVKWDRPLLGRDGKPIALGAEPIPMIPKGESASVLVTSSHDLISTNEDTTYTGTISFKNSRGRTFSELFTITAEHERHAMVLATDDQEMKADLKRIREALEKIENTIRRS